MWDFANNSQQQSEAAGLGSKEALSGWQWAPSAASRLLRSAAGGRTEADCGAVQR